MSVAQGKTADLNHTIVPRKGNGFSIWLIPDDRSRGTLSLFFKRLDSIAGKALPVDPHVTIAGSLKCGEAEVFSFARKAAQRVKAESLLFYSPGKQNDYFRSFYLSADISSPLLSSLRKLVLMRFDSLPPRAFSPHLSLAYGFSPDESLEKRIFSGCCFPIKFFFHRMCVVKTEGFVPAWRLIGSFPLRGSS